MSGTFPSSPSPSTFQLRSLAPTRVSIAQSLKRQVRTTGAQRWAASLSWLPRTRAEMAPIIAFLAAQEGQFGSFQISLPPLDTQQGSWAGSPVVNGGGQVGSSVNVRNFTAGATVKAGDMWCFSGHTKVYMATADATANGAGLAALQFKPKLIVSPADGESFFPSGILFTMMQASDLMAVSAQPPALFTWSLELMEAY